MNVRELDLDGNGWYIKVGQVYFSPWESTHFLVTRIELDVDDEKHDAMVYYKEVSPTDYSEIVLDEEQHCRAWWINVGDWDLELYVE